VGEWVDFPGGLSMQYGRIALKILAVFAVTLALLIVLRPG
jgi:hypothetical protein